MNRRHVVDAQEQVQQALYDYTVNCYAHIPVSQLFDFNWLGLGFYIFSQLNFKDKFAKMLAILPDIHAMSSRGEEYLYFKHLNGCAPTQTLLMEMLHAKRKWESWTANPTRWETRKAHTKLYQKRGPLSLFQLLSIYWFFDCRLRLMCLFFFFCYLLIDCCVWESDWVSECVSRMKFEADGGEKNYAKCSRVHTFEFFSF